MLRKVILLVVCASIIGELRAWDLPDLVAVGSDGISSDEFSLWKSSDARDYVGIYSSDVGGDSTGVFQFRIDSADPDGGFTFASGEFVLRVAGMKWATTMKFENAISYDDDMYEGIFDVGAFRVFFVKHRYPDSEVVGVIVNNVFLPRIERMVFIDGESNFRTGPNTRSQVKFQPREGTAGTVIGREGNWIMIQLDDGDSGWAHKQNLRPVK